MDENEILVKEINSLASIVRTTLSQISTDWVLDINCYSTNMPDSKLEHLEGMDGSRICHPCEVPKTEKLEKRKSREVSTGESSLETPSKSSKHTATQLSSCSFSFPGILNRSKLYSFLDDILFGNGARVGGGYRQPNITYVSLLDDEKEKTESTLLKGKHGKDYDEIFVFSSAPKKPTVQDTEITAVKETVNHSVDSDKMMIFRVKGVLHVKDEEYLQVLQGVFDIFEVKSSSFLYGSNGDKSGGLNRIIVIGRNIDQDEVEQGFISCLDT
jgi:G3E family GTPase